MTGDHDDLDDLDDITEDDLEEVDVLDDDDDDDDSTDELDIPNVNVGETSVEIDIEQLIADLEAESGLSAGCRKDAPRKRLERILEERRAARELEEIDDFAFDTFD